MSMSMSQHKWTFPKEKEAKKTECFVFIYIFFFVRLCSGQQRHRVGAYFQFSARRVSIANVLSCFHKVWTESDICVSVCVDWPRTPKGITFHVSHLYIHFFPVRVLNAFNMVFALDPNSDDNEKDEEKKNWCGPKHRTRTHATNERSQIRKITRK